MKPNMLIMAENVPQRLQAVLSAELETLWKFYESPQTDLDLLVRITHSEAFTQNEADEGEPPKYVSYPETIEVKFEADSNMFYSMRVSDRRFIREGVALDSDGLCGESVCKRVINDLTSQRKRRIGVERFAELMNERGGAR